MCTGSVSYVFLGVPQGATGEPLLCPKNGPKSVAKTLRYG
jgi:hypothetical protein